MNLVAHLGLRVKDSIKAYDWVKGLFSNQHLWGCPWMDVTFSATAWTECRNLLDNLCNDVEIVHRQLFELLVQCQFTDGVQSQLLEVWLMKSLSFVQLHLAGEYDPIICAALCEGDFPYPVE